MSKFLVLVAVLAALVAATALFAFNQPLSGAAMADATGANAPPTK